MGKKNNNYWNLDTMNQYCNEQNNGYKILEIKWVEKPYQKQLWAFIKCPIKEHEPYWMWWNHFYKKDNCKQCSYDKLRKRNLESFDVTTFYKNYGLTILNINEWKNVDSKMSCIDKLGFKYKTSVTVLRQSGKSFIFNKRNPYSLENIKLFCKLYRPEYEIISDTYNGIKESYLWKYNGEFYNNKICDREFYCTADGFVNGFVKHPNLTKSKLDLKVRYYLNKYNICYVTEKTFDGCIDIIKLRFDFYIKHDNKEWCIEADGLQHEIIIEQWGGLKGLQDRIKKDNIKNKFCKDNNINLIRIPQAKINHIEQIIIDTFNVDIKEINSERSA